MKLSLLVGGAVGYVLGARAGQERYEQLVRIGRRIAGSQTVQSAAGVAQAQLESLKAQARHAVSAKLSGQAEQPSRVDGLNGHRPVS
jgi:alkylation response protein AidB-like acyl-CoA dehydrogenase